MQTSSNQLQQPNDFDNSTRTPKLKDRNGANECRAGFPACRFWRLFRLRGAPERRFGATAASRQFQWRELCAAADTDAELESPVNRQAGKPALRPWRRLFRNSDSNDRSPLRLIRLLAIAFFPIALALASGCRSSREAYSSAFVHFDAGSATYATNCLQEGDVVSITFQYSTNFNTVQKIGLDGSLNLMTVGQIKAAGKTSLQLQDELTKRYQPEVKDDPLTLKVVSTAAAVYVSGAVAHPGKIQMERPMTVLEAIMEAGGFDSYRAKLSTVSVLRVENGRQRFYELNLERTLSGEEEFPFYLKPFDVVRVPTKTFNF